MSTLSIGWTQADAHRSLTRFRRLLAVNLALQSLVALLCILAPSCGAWITGIEPSLARPLLPVWGGLVLLVSALQVLAWLDPVRQRFQVAIALAGRVLMALIYLCLGWQFWRFAIFDAGFALALGMLFHRALIAEIQTRT
ncbi:MAG: hypothetical protein CMP09_18615 [Yangia sp.]|nr:hypothetical protein [Salipiger sp.]